MMKALLIVDMQNDFCPGGELGVEGGDLIVPVINKMMDNFDFVLASKDWHPPDSEHFDQWPVHCVKYTEGAQFHPDLITRSIDAVLLKGTGKSDNGYSAFEASNLNLLEYLRENSIKELYICGLATDYCVKHTALDASKHGFATFVIADGIKAVNLKPDDGKHAIEEMKEAGCEFVDSRELVVMA